MRLQSLPIVPNQFFGVLFRYAYIYYLNVTILRFVDGDLDQAFDRTTNTCPGVADSVGWQFLVAIVNIGSYYVLGLLIGALLGYKFKHSAPGIWIGMLTGRLMQAVVLLFIIL